MKLVAIGGQPATGKSTLMRSLMDAIEPRWQNRHFKDGLVHGHYLAGRIIVLGRYDTGRRFCGTDLLSMAVAPQVVRFAQRMPADHVLAFEGDRLFNRSTLEVLRGKFEQSLILQLACGAATLGERRRARAVDNQSDPFLRGRATKLSNLSDLSEFVRCETEADRCVIVARILAFIACP